MKHKLWTKDYILLLLTTFFAAITHNIFTAVFPLYVIDIGGDTALAGAMITGLTIAVIITRLFTGFLSDSFGRRTLLIVGATLFTLNTVAYIFVTDITGLFILRICNGISQGIYFGSAAISVAHIVHTSRLIDGIGYFGIAGALAAAVAPMVGLDLFGRYGAKPLFIFVSISAGIGIIFTLLMKKDDVKQQEQSQEKKKFNLSFSAFFDFSIIVPALIYFLIMFGNSSIVNFLPTFGVARQIANISLFFFVNNIAMIIVRMCNGYLLKCFGFNKLLIVSSLLMIGSLIAIAFSYTMIPIIITGILFGIGMGIGIPLLNTIIFDLSNPERKGVASSTFALMGDVGNGFGAFLWGMLSEYNGYMMTYLLSSICIMVAMLFHIFILNPKLKKQNIEK